MTMSLTRRLAAWPIGVALWGFAGAALADYELNMPKGVTDISNEVYSLHMLIFWITVVIGIGVFGAMFYSIYRHRKSKGHAAEQFHEKTSVEVVWTIIPFLILVGMAVPATKTLIAMEDTTESDLTVKVTGYQWKWHYDYINQDIAFFSNLATPRAQIHNAEQKAENYLLEVDNPLVLPTGKKVRLLITAADVIHAWWVPDLAVKKDAIPGFINEVWTKIEEPGVYRGQCAELCGRDHGFMPITVVAKSPADYKAWVKAQKADQEAEKVAAGKDWTMSDLMAKGEKVYNASCAACHQPDGKGIPGSFPPIKDSPVATGEIDKHMDIVVNGVDGTAMQAFGPQLSKVELAAVITYQRNAFGNDTGDKVQPSDIKGAE